MIHFSFLRPAAAIALVSLTAAASTVRADQESDLLRKFQQQNQQAAQQAKETVEKSVQRAFEVIAQEPEQALEILRQAREVLNGADALPRPDKVLLTRRLDEGFRNVKARLESKEEAAKKLAKPLAPEATADAKLFKKVDGATGAAARDPKLGVRQLIFESNNVPMTFSSSASVAPVVSPDRRWVRISISGMFSIR